MKIAAIIAWGSAFLMMLGTLIFLYAVRWYIKHEQDVHTEEDDDGKH